MLQLSLAEILFKLNIRLKSNSAKLFNSKGGGVYGDDSS